MERPGGNSLRKLRNPSQIRAHEATPGQVRLQGRRPDQARFVEIGVGQVRVAEIGAIQVGAAEIGAGAVEVRHVRADEGAISEARRLQVEARQRGAGEIDGVQVGAGEDEILEGLVRAEPGDDDAAELGPGVGLGLGDGLRRHGAGRTRRLDHPGPVDVELRRLDAGEDVHPGEIARRREDEAATPDHRADRAIPLGAARVDRQLDGLFAHPSGLRHHVPDRLALHPGQAISEVGERGSDSVDAHLVRLDRAGSEEPRGLPVRELEHGLDEHRDTPLPLVLPGRGVGRDRPETHDLQRWRGARSRGLGDRARRRRGREGQDRPLPRRLDRVVRRERESLERQRRPAGQDGIDRRLDHERIDRLGGLRNRCAAGSARPSVLGVPRAKGEGR